MNWPQLSAYLEQVGRADTDGVRLRARYTRCAACNTPVLTGLDAPVLGLPVVCDTTDLDAPCEFAALLTGRPTFTVFELPDGLQLGHRDQWAIRGARQARPVVAEHRCGHPVPASTVFRWRIPADRTTQTDAPF